MAYAYYVPLVVQSSEVTGTVTDFVALLNHTFAPWKSVANGGHVQNIGVGLPLDWQVYADSGLTTPLNYELVSWDTTTGAIVGWIQTNVATATTVYIAYGDAAQTTYQGNSAATWGGIGFVAVFHMDALFGSFWADELTTWTLTNTGGTVVAGKIDDAGDFNGSTQYATVSAAPVTAAPLTLSCWYNPATLVSDVLISVLNTAGGWSGWALGLENTPNDHLEFFAVQNNFGTFGVASKTGPATGAFYHLAGVEVSNASRYAYVNAVAGTQETTSVTPNLTPDNLTLAAARQNTIFSTFADGALDEVRVHDVARDAAWLEAEYHSQNNATAFWVLGSEVPVGGGAAWSPYISPWGWQ